MIQLPIKAETAPDAGHLKGEGTTCGGKARITVERQRRRLKDANGQDVVDVAAQGPTTSKRTGRLKTANDGDTLVLTGPRRSRDPRTRARRVREPVRRRGLLAPLQSSTTTDYPKARWRHVRETGRTRLKESSEQKMRPYWPLAIMLLAACGREGAKDESTLTSESSAPTASSDAGGVSMRRERPREPRLLRRPGGASTRRRARPRVRLHLRRPDCGTGREPGAPTGRRQLLDAQSRPRGDHVEPVGLTEKFTGKTSSTSRTRDHSDRRDHQ